MAKMPIRAPSKPAPKAVSKAPAKAASMMVPSHDMDVRIRKIENGFVVTKSGMTGTGPRAKYVTTGVFTPKMPKI